MAEVLWWIVKWAAIVMLISIVVAIVHELVTGIIRFVQAIWDALCGKESRNSGYDTEYSLKTYEDYEDSDWDDGQETRVVNVTYNNNTYHIHLYQSAYEDQRKYDNLDEEGRDVVYINGRRYVEDKRY